MRKPSSLHVKISYKLVLKQLSISMYAIAKTDLTLKNDEGKMIVNQIGSTNR